MHQVWIKKTNTSEPPYTCRKCLDGVETGVVILLWEEAWRMPADCPGGVRHRGGVSLIRAFALNCGNLSPRCIRERHKRRSCEAYGIEARHRGGQARSSEKTPVMGVERRDLATWRDLMGQLNIRRSR